MPLITVINNFLTTAQLRQEIGQPTYDTADPGYIPDSFLESIIQRHHDNAVEQARVMAHERVQNNQLPCEKRLFSPVSITLAASANQPTLLEGAIGATYYPFVLQVVDSSGNDYNYDQNVAEKMKTTFTKRYVYNVVGRNIYVGNNGNGTNDPSQVYVHLALEDNVWDFLFSGDMVEKYNKEIINEAAYYMDRIIQEGIRLESIIDINDEVPGDLT